MISSRQMWFPLRSNIAYFEGSAYQSKLENRIKQACILADEVIFEPGGIDIAVAAGGLLAIPFDVASMEDKEIRSLRANARSGTPFAFQMGGPSADADADFTTLLAGERERGFFAEYHLLLRDTGLEEASWIRFGRPSAETEVVSKAIAAALDREDRYRDDLPVLAGNDFLDTALRQDLNADLAAAAVMELAVSVDPLREPLVRSRQSMDEALRGAALDVWVPDFTNVPWKEIRSLHDHDAIGAFRSKLEEAEEAVAGLPPGEEQSRALGDFGLDELAKQAEAILPSALRSAARIGAGAALDVTVGSFPVSNVMASVTEIARYRRARLEWTTVLLRLKKAAR